MASSFNDVASTPLSSRNKVVALSPSSSSECLSSLLSRPSSLHVLREGDGDATIATPSCESLNSLADTAAAICDTPLGISSRYDEAMNMSPALTGHRNSSYSSSTSKVKGYKRSHEYHLGDDDSTHEKTVASSSIGVKRKIVTHLNFNNWVEPTQAPLYRTSINEDNHAIVPPLSKDEEDEQRYNVPSSIKRFKLIDCTAKVLKEETTRDVNTESSQLKSSNPVEAPSVSVMNSSAGSPPPLSVSDDDNEEDNLSPTAYPNGSDSRRDPAVSNLYSLVASELEESLVDTSDIFSDESDEMDVETSVSVEHRLQPLSAEDVHTAMGSNGRIIIDVNGERKHSALASRDARTKWSVEEDEALCAAVARYNGTNWRRIADAVPGRVDVQCLHRWKKVLNPDVTKGSWAPDEDALLRSLVEKCDGNRARICWSRIASQLSGRMGKQCRERWCNHLDPAVRKDSWTEQEEQMLLQAHDRLGNRWTKIAVLLPGRSANTVKNRYNCIIRKQTSTNTKYKTTATAARILANLTGVGSSNSDPPSPSNCDDCDPPSTDIVTITDNEVIPKHDIGAGSADNDAAISLVTLTPQGKCR